MNPQGFRFCGGCGSALAAPPAAERRQLTVMFFDLVGSTTLSSQLDPEELRDLVQRYQEVCNGVVARHGGHVAQYLGDGILVYFGYPLSHEDDGRRALAAALDILEAMAELNGQLRHRLDLRVGIHTGLVVVGAIGTRERRENLALGETPNVAARLQGVAGINEVVCSAATLRLAVDHFETEDTGLHDLKGVPEPMRVHRVVRRLTAAEARLRSRRRRAELPLVGRSEELAWLQRAWRALPQSSVLGVVGEAGIGKSRLLEEWKDEVLAAGPALLSMYGSPEETAVPLAALAQVLQRELSLRKFVEQPLTSLARELGLAPAQAVPVMAHLLRLPSEGWPEPAHSPAALREACFGVMNALAVSLAGRPGGLLVCVDGFEWIDPSSAEWLTGLERVLAEHAAVVVFAGRRNVPASQLLRLGPLGAAAAQELVELCAPQALSATEVVRRGEGVPLFLIELCRWNDAHRVPGGLHDFFMARVDCLPDARGVAQQAAVVGRRFASSLLRELALRPIEGALDCLLEHAVVQGAGLGEELEFCHGLMRDACYDSLLKSVRQAHHGRLAELVADQPALAAHHWRLSSHPERALAPLAQAARRCFSVSALVEAGQFLGSALEIVRQLPAGPERDRCEAQILSLQGAASIAHRGYAAPETEELFARAARLCAADSPDFAVLAGIWALRLTQGRLQEAEELSVRLLELAHSEETRLVARSARGQTLFFRGAPLAALPFLQEAAAGYDRSQAGRALAYFLTDPAVASTSYLALCLTLLGEAASGRAQAAAALERASELQHAHTLAHTLAFDCWLRCCHRDTAEAERGATHLAQLADQEKFALWAGMARIFLGSARLARGDAAGAALLAEGLHHVQGTGAQLGATWVLAQLADAQPDAIDALGLLEQAVQLAEASGERWFLPGLLQRQASRLPEAAGELQQARARELALASGSRFFLRD